MEKYSYILILFIGLHMPALHAGENVMAKEVFTDWTYLCGRQDIAEGRCAIMQSHDSPYTGQNILTIVVPQPGYKESPYALLETPLSVSLPEGVTFQIDDEEEEFQLAYLVCQVSGCQAKIDLGDVLLPAMIKGRKLKLGYVEAYSQKHVSVSVSLSGFTKAFKNLVK